MYSFVALIWNDLDDNALSEAFHFSDLLLHSGSDLTLTFSANGTIVFTATPKEKALRPYLLPRDGGVILGRLFCRAASDVLTDAQIDEGAAIGIVRTGGDRLVSDYWGAYVAILRDLRSHRSCVIRDCSGWIPCYRTRHANVDIVFSDLRDLLPLRLPPFTFNYRYMAASIYAPLLHIRECAFAEVTEVLAGESVEFKNSSTRQLSVWDPTRITARRSIEQYSEAEAELRSTTQACIDAWAKAYSNETILISLSGGLDSAIVLGSLTNAPLRPRLSCFNQCLENTADDERRYARIAAARAGVPLIELAWSSVRLDEQLFSIPMGPKPYPGEIYWWLERHLRNDLAMRTGASAIWTGQGGDHLFWAFGRFPVAADYVSRHGVDLRLFRTIRDVAHLGRQCYASVFRTAFRLARSNDAWTPDEISVMKGHFVNRDALPANCNEYTTHPWASTTASLPKAKSAQIMMLAEVLNRHHHMARAECAYQRHPLLAQPLIELCLQIPSYVLVEGGSQRALARTAFCDRVPKEIIGRKDKGDTTAHVRAMIRQNGPFLCDLLLSGVLVEQRIVTRHELELILAHGQSYRPENLWALLACITMEIWAQKWKTSTLRVAA